MELSPKEVGRKIREIRRRRHLSQLELARRLGMRAGPVNCIEKGRNFPSARVLHRLATVLDVPIDAFFETHATSGSLVREERARYVTHGKTIPLGPHAVLVRDKDEIKEIKPAVLGALGELTDAILALEDICGAQKSADIPLYLPFSFSPAGIGHLVTRTRRLMGINDAIIFDYIELFENTGLRVLFCDLPAELESIGCYDEENANAFIIVRAGMNVERQLFRLVYELGRVYRHTQKRRPGAHCGRPPLTRRRKPLTDHRTARIFAALFLQPAEAVQASVRQLGITPREWTWDLILRLKHRFGVSAETFIYRLAELKLMTTELESRFREQLYTHYEQTDYSEPNQSRRILTPNGRIGDLLLCARELRHSEEADTIAIALQRHGCEMDNKNSPGICN